MKKNILIYLGLLLLAYLVVHPHYNPSRMCHPNTAPAYDDTILYGTLDKTEPLPGGGRIVVPFMENFVAEIITAGKFSRKVYTKENLYSPLFKPLIYHWLNITLGSCYDGTRNAVSFVSNYLVDFFFVFLAFLFLYYSMRLLKLNLLSMVFGFLYMALFTIYYTWYMGRSTDMPALAVWMIITYLYLLWHAKLFDNADGNTAKGKFIINATIAVFFAAFIGILIREVTIIPVLLCAAILFIRACLMKRLDFAAAGISLALVLGGFLGIYVYYNWPQSSISNLSNVTSQGTFYAANIGSIVSIIERLLFPFLPLLVLLLYRSARMAFKKYYLLFIFALLSILGHFAALFIFGASLICEASGLFTPHISLGALCFAILINYAVPTETFPGKS